MTFADSNKQTYFCHSNTSRNHPDMRFPNI